MFTEPAPTPYDLSWRMFGIAVRVHPLFWLISAFLNSELLKLGFQYLILWIACVFVSILLHEFGHVVAGLLFGSRGHIVLYSFGGLAIGSSNVDRRWQKVIVLFAGPGVQLLLYGFLQLINHQELPLFEPRLTNYWFRGFKFLLAINLFWPILNLLPIWPLDGGQISRELSEAVAGGKGVRFAYGLSMTVAALLALNALAGYSGHPLPIVGEWMGDGGIYSILLFGVLAYGSWQALQASHERQRWTDGTWQNDDSCRDDSDN